MKVSIQPIASVMSRRAIGEVNRRIQNAGKAELQADQIEKAQGFRAVEARDEIHAGIGGLFTARN